MRITAKSNVCIIIGDPVEHSRSPQMYQAAFEGLGIDDKYVFVAGQVKPTHLEQAISGLRALGVRGITVTAPHKTAVMELLDDIDPVAQKIGAVNTIVNENGTLTGYNTDWQGIVNALESISTITDKKIAVLGAGGAARGAVYGFTKHGGNVTIFNRTIEKAKALAEEFGCGYASMDDAAQVTAMDIIFNATSVGLHPHEHQSPLSKDFLTANHIVFDAVYSPFETQLLKDAKEKGATVVHGLDMLLYQGAEQFKLYTGYDAPTDIMRRELYEK